uniref:Uncharacterized protein n=1 Tax=Rhizophora mucronata TaxID=61149 RepID=A0A2P2PQP6_RHIMU
MMIFHQLAWGFLFKHLCSRTMWSTPV